MPAASRGLVALVLIALAPAFAAPPQQTGFSAVRAGKAVRFQYTFSEREGGTHRLEFAIPAAEIAAARAGFRAHNPEELRGLAKAEQRRLLEAEVDGLASAYPRAQIALDADGVVTWRVGAGADAPAEQRQAFDRAMAEEIARLRDEYPRVYIQVSAGAYQVRGADQTGLAEVMRRLRAAEGRANQAVARLVEQQRAGLEEGAAAIGDELAERIAAVEQAMAGFEAAYYLERRYRLHEDRSLRPDYARIARESVEPLAPVAAALADSTRGGSWREVVDRLLLFLQTIPYDPLDDRATGAGFSPPLVVLADNRGDCDSKSVSFAAIAHRLQPDLPIALVLVPGHALVALATPPERGDRTLRHAGRTWVLAEPVGPGAYPMGRIAEESERGLGRVEAFVTLFP
ncbi:MAG: hypothetical protein MUC77_12100 [Chromatiaceae bacterium]|jgi:hypothetical protein|nr:hypothetical protein [Chromatiaceae bacterium]